MNFAKEVAGLPGLTKTNAKQLRKVSALAGTAMLTALDVVVDALFIPITPALRIGFSSILAAVCGMYYGPTCTGLAGVIADTLKYIIRPGGPYSPGFAVNEFLTGMMYGYFFYRKEITPPRVVTARACITVFINLILISPWLNMMYQSPFFTMAQLIKNVVTFSVDVALLYAVLRGAGGVCRI